MGPECGQIAGTDDPGSCMDAKIRRDLHRRPDFRSRFAGLENIKF